MFREDYLQIPVCFIRNWAWPAVMRERGKLDSYLDFYDLSMYIFKHVYTAKCGIFTYGYDYVHI